jgi:DNA helicase IV
LCYVRELVFASLPEEEKPSLTILADENQRITATNSTMGQIRAAHLLTDDDVYRLEHNYRNTREIAKLAAVFYTGLESGKPKLPTHRGDKPKLVITGDIGDAVRRIVEYVRVYDEEDLGILVMYNATRKKFFNRLTARLKGTAIRVQTYTSDSDDEHHDIEKLKFDKGGSITVLCFASSKGLEFDAVFLPELQTVNVANDETQTTLKSNLYVMCSRARKRLFLMVSDSERGSPIWSILPRSQELVELET